jgi:hypothetical protein
MRRSRGLGDVYKRQADFSVDDLCPHCGLVIERED